MPTCYNLIYNSATGLVEKEGSLITYSSGISGFCSDGYTILISAVNGTTTDELLNLSADSAVTSAINDINNKITLATNSSLLSADINSNINNEVVNLKVSIIIVPKTPVIRTVYNPVPVTPKTDVVKKG